MTWLNYIQYRDLCGKGNHKWDIMKTNICKKNPGILKFNLYYVWPLNIGLDSGEKNIDYHCSVCQPLSDLFLFYFSEIMILETSEKSWYVKSTENGFHNWSVFSVTAISYTNSVVNAQMNACMTVPSFSILFGLYLFGTLPKLFWWCIGKWENALAK